MSESLEESVFIVKNTSPVRIDTYLAEQLGRSRAFVQSQIRNQRVERNGKALSRSSTEVQLGDRIVARVEESTTIPGLVPVAAELDILYEDEALLVINKPQGMVVHPAPGTLGSTLVHHLLYYLRSSPGFEELSPSRPGIVHRLDRGTSGVLVIGKTGLAHERLGRQFHDRVVLKRYEAIVWGIPQASGTIRSHIGRARYDRTVMVSHAAGGKLAVTAWKTLEQVGTFSRVSLFPKTGRTHQLRVHLKDLGHPIVGDPTYKKSDYFRSVPTLNPRIQTLIQRAIFPFLHAEAIELNHPLTGQRIHFQAPRPSNFLSFWETARQCCV